MSGIGLLCMVNIVVVGRVVVGREVGMVMDRMVGMIVDSKA